MIVCSNRARNAVRDAGRADQNARSLRPMLGRQSSGGDSAPGTAYDRLPLIASRCRPLLSTNAQVAVTLRMVARIYSVDTAPGLRTPIPTLAQMIARAK